MISLPISFRTPATRRNSKVNLYRNPWVAAIGLVFGAIALSDAGPPATLFEVQNGSWERFQEAVHITLTPGQVKLLEKKRLVELGPNGERLGPVHESMDRSDPGHVALSWVPPGITAPGALRRFALVPEEKTPAPSNSDLELEEDKTHIVVSNSFFEITYNRKGNGGFPARIFFRLSGNSETRLRFLDRLYRRSTHQQFFATEDAEATARVLFRSPERIVIESRARYSHAGEVAPGNVQAVYRYVYSPSSPVVEVAARIEREDGELWNELHFLHPSRADFHYTRFLTGEPPEEHAMASPGTKSRAHGGRHWGVMATGQDAVGVAFRGVTCWDASDEFVYYVRGNTGQWRKRTASFAGLLYFGPASEDFDWFSRWLGPTRNQKVRLVEAPDSATSARAGDTALEGAYELRNRSLRIVFSGEDKGFSCIGIQNLIAGGARFVHPREGAPGLWKLEFRGPWKPVKKGKPFREEPVIFDNLANAKRTAEWVKSNRGQTLKLRWSGLDLPGEPAAVDVVAEVRLASGSGPSEWNIRVVNRSRKLGLWQIHFPLLSQVCPKGQADVLLPTGNWGGTLRHNFKGAFRGTYPSGQCPVQFMAFHLGQAGLYFGAHDGGARAKQLQITGDQDAMITTDAENMGVPGSGAAPWFPVVVQAYRGDWWQAARIYRAWASRQAWTRKGLIRDRKDIPEHFKNLGLWMLGGGNPDSVRTWMLKAQELFPVPVGLHWYNWHVIPFDNSYPEYFPTKKDFGKVVRGLVGRGQVMMPYINGRLWDRDIESFKTGIQGASKQRSGEPYTEIYGSGRRLAPMCPFTRLWQDKVNEIIGRLIHECGVNAVYLDQIGAARPRPCFDPSHGHPLGGGRWWVDGYRKLLDRVKAQGVASSVAFTTENTAEPYMDNIDGFLAWSQRNETDVPLLPAVYSGYTIYFSSPESENDDLDSFVMAQGRDFLWGCQLGWNGNWLLAEKHRAKAQLLGRLAQYRLAARKFLVEGRLLDEVRPSNSLRTRTSTWYRRKQHTAALPSVMATFWQAGDGSLCTMMVNFDPEPQRFEYQVKPTNGGRANDARGWLCSLLTPEGQTPWEFVSSDSIQRSELLGGHEIRAVVFQPFKEKEVLVEQAKKIARAHTAISALGAAARAFLFQQTVEKLGLEIRLAKCFLTVAAGEPAEAILHVRNSSGTKQDLRITWPDRRTTSVAALPGKEVEARQVFWPSKEGAWQTETAIEIALEDGGPGRELRLPLAIHSVPPVSIEMGSFSNRIRGGESFLLPLEVRNHSRVTRSGTLELAVPPGWRIEPGRQMAVDALPPGGRRSALLKCTAPPGKNARIVNLALRFVEHSLNRPIEVLPARPSALCTYFSKPPSIDGNLEEWKGLPAIKLGDENRGQVKVTKNYRGPRDCSASIRVAWNETYFFLAAEVLDDVFHQEESGFSCWRGDCIQLAFRAGSPSKPSGYDGTEYEVGLTKSPEGPILFQWMPGARPLEEGRLAVVRDEKVTRYEAAVPWKTLGVKRPIPSGRVTWSMTVNDNDGQGFRGWLEWTPGVCGAKDSSEFGWLKFRKK